jgi:excisionase family DNA binding protein
METNNFLLSVTETTSHTGLSSKPLSVAEAAAYTGLSKTYLYKLIHMKEIPYYKPMGGKVFFKQAELDEFIYRHRVSANYELKEKAAQLLIEQRKVKP